MTELYRRLAASGLFIATNNAGKQREFERLLGPLNIPLYYPASLGIELEPEETAPDFVGNALLKARAFYAAAGRPALADDSGLAVDALGGEPGVLSARYGGPGLDERGRRRRVLAKLDELSDAAAPERRTARFICVLALVLDAVTPPRLFEGVVEGRILSAERGDGGFGYDPIFEDLVTGRSFAELEPREKDSRSHRGRALAAFMAALGAPVPSL
jgi:XTP/dITP diphosphohydrolase